MSMRLPEGLCPAVIVFSDRGDWVYSNPSVEALTGYAPGSIGPLQEWLTRLFPFDDDRSLVARLMGHLSPDSATGATERFFADFCTQMGERRPGAFQVHAWREPGRGCHLMLCFLVREIPACPRVEYLAPLAACGGELELGREALGELTARVQHLLDWAVSVGRPLLESDAGCSGCMGSLLAQVERARGLMLGIEEMQRCRRDYTPAAAGPVSPPC